MAKTLIETLAQKLRLIPNLDREKPAYLQGPLRKFPEPDAWHDHVELDAQAWPQRVERRYSLVPTTCFNCESACGLLAYVDKDSGHVSKLEGNPHHPGSRGRNCAKGPATINQLKDTERILHPLRRKGPRGSGEWEQITWDEALDEIASKIRTSLKQDHRGIDKVVYHVGRPGHEGYTNRVLKAWGVDGHNSHTNICSAGARTGYALWHKHDRPSPDHSNAKVILLTSSHLETGHYFNPHAQRILEGMMDGAKLVVIDPRLSNTAAMADHWVPTWPGSEPALFLAWAKMILEAGAFDREFMEHQVNWDAWMKAVHPNEPCEFDRFIERLLGRADAAECDQRAVEVEGLHGLDEAFTALAQLVIERHAHFVEEDGTALSKFTAHGVVDLHRHTRSVHRYQDGAKVSTAAGFPHTHESDGVVGEASEGTRCFLARNDPMIAIADCPGADGRGV